MRFVNDTPLLLKSCYISLDSFIVSFNHQGMAQMKPSITTGFSMVECL